MTHKLIETKHYLLVVDDSDMVGKGYRLDITRMSVGVIDDDFLYNARKDWFKKIIAHLPLNGSPILEGVDLLPPYSRHQEDGLEELAQDWYDKGELTSAYSFKAGYNKAREKYKYTEEDVRKAITMARDLEDWQDLVWEYEYDDIIQSLHQYPTEFECEMEQYYNEVGNDGFEFDSSSTIPPPRPKTITTAQGIQWVGKYK